MADGKRPALGLSIGATNLAAVTADRAVTRKPVLTLYRRRPPEVGVVSANAEQAESDVVITDFVDRVGDPVEVVAADGSTHRGETLVADALQALAHTALDGRTLPGMVTVTHPAHWEHAAVDALTGALDRVSEWSDGPLSLVPDFAAALAALQRNPGVPSRGIIAVCDFGGSGTSLTLVDAANGYQAVAPTVRYAGFSGDLIDQALLDQVVADLSSAGSLDTSETSAIGSLTRLRAACRRAKEELSATTAATLTAELPGFGGDVRLSRSEFDDAIRPSLDGFVTRLQQALQRNEIRAADVVAVASVGGGANIPAITRTLIEQLRVPVVTTPRPDLTAAVGAALRTGRGSTDGSRTALAPTASGPESLSDTTTMLEIPPEANFTPALAWSEVDDDSDIMPFTGEYPEPGEEPADEPDAGGEPTARAAGAWYRPSVVVIVVTALAVLAILAAILLALRQGSGGAPTTPTTEVSPQPSTTTEVPSTSQSPPPETTIEPAPPPPETTVEPLPPPPPPAPPPRTTATQPPPPPPETTTPPPSPSPSVPPPPVATEPTTQAPPPTEAPPTQAPQYPRYPPRREPANPFSPNNPRNPFSPNNPQNPFSPYNPYNPMNPGY
jgi:hypothetical protein